jgi:hypothetical protein
MLSPFIIAVTLRDLLAFSPQRTPQRDKLFFGVVSDAPAANPGILLPPANSQLGVNSTATNNFDYNDYGSVGVPADVLAVRAQAAEQSGTISSPKGASFLINKDPIARVTNNPVKSVSNVLSVIWLVLFMVGISIFLHTALTAGSRKVKLSAAAEKFARKTVENRRIDREAYVYVDGG